MPAPGNPHCAITQNKKSVWVRGLCAVAPRPMIVLQQFDVCYLIGVLLSSQGRLLVSPINCEKTYTKLATKAVR